MFFGLTPQNMARTSEDLMNQGQRSVQQFQQAFNDLFNRYAGGMVPMMSAMMPGMATGPQGMETTRYWDVTMHNKGDEMIIRAEVPGFELEDLHVEMRENQLTIRAERCEKEDGQQNYRTFYRTLTLPQDVKAEQIHASYRNGILELHVPRSEQAAGKRIPIHGEDESQSKRKGNSK